MKSKPPETVALFGLPISNVTMGEAVARIDTAIQCGGTHQIATANLDFARNALLDSALQHVICDCSMVLPDGAPMLWASRLLGKPLKARVTGVDLIPELARLSARKGYRIFFLGSTEKSSEQAQQVLESQCPGVRIVGRYSPPVTSLELMNHSAILQEIAKAKPDILLVAFGNPKQELWIHRFKSSLHVPVLIGIGGSLEMISGSVRRAPRPVQKLQIEWLYRVAQEPARLLPRYARDAAALFRHLPLGFLVHKMQPQQSKGQALTVKCGSATRQVVLPERVSGEVCLRLWHEAERAVAEGQNLLLNMRKVHRVDADGLGCLMEARRMLHGRGQALCLAELSATVTRVMEYSAVKDLFLIAETVHDATQRLALRHAEESIHLVRRLERSPQTPPTQHANVA